MAGAVKSLVRAFEGSAACWACSARHHEAISTAQVQALSARLAALHAARLLSDDELFGLEDCIADFVEAKGSAVDVLAMPLTTISAVGTVCKLAMVSESVAQDAMFARQLRRKFA